MIQNNLDENNDMILKEEKENLKYFKNEDKKITFGEWFIYNKNKKNDN